MNNHILQTFYQRMMPLYTPQAEKFLDTALPNTFSHVSFRYTFTVEAMTNLSHIIENAVMTNRTIADLHVSFQYFSRVLPQESRYLEIAKNAKGLWLYGVPDIPLPKLQSQSRTTLIDTTDTLLEHYWFVVAFGPGIGMTLLAEEIPALEGSDRYYEGFYSFEADVAYQLIAIMHGIYPNQVPQPTSPENFGIHA